MKLSQSVREIYRPGAAAAAAPLNTAEQALYWFIFFFGAGVKKKKKKTADKRQYGEQPSGRLQINASPPFTVKRLESPEENESGGEGG